MDRSSCEKKIAIMQPYFFPYIVYWQMLAAVDVFVIYDEGKYINGGWIHKNRILRGKVTDDIRLCLSHANGMRRICDIGLDPRSHDQKKKLCRTVKFSYARAAYFNEVFPLVTEILMCDEMNLSRYLINQIRLIAEYLGIGTKIIVSSEIKKAPAQTAIETIKSICDAEKIHCYVNLPGGRKYYSPEEFAEKGVSLRFIDRNELSYPQIPNAEFIPDLSVIDVLMNCGADGMRRLLSEYRISDK